MPDLAACYFCGAADGAESVDVAADSSVTLCGTCQEKLETVLEAMDSDGAGSEAAAGPGAQPTDGATSAPEEPSGAHAEEDRSVVGGDQAVSALEYNKVMRMLKNREFPVDRDQFVAVAANAYQVAHVDCDRVIDAAIEEGLIDEEDGQLVRVD